MKLNINIIIIILILLTIALFLSKTETFETIQPDIMYSLDDAELIRSIYMPGSQGPKGAVGNPGRNRTETIGSNIMIQKTLDEMFQYGVAAAPAPVAAAPVVAAPVAAAPVAAAPAPVVAAPVVTAPPIIPYCDMVDANGHVTIKAGTTIIKNDEFKDCGTLKTITIPNSVTSIGNNAFRGCETLKTITIPNSVTSIGKAAFRECHSLTSITIPNSVTSIGAEAFFECWSLPSITLPNNITTINKYTFFKCYKLSSIIIPNGVTSIGEHAFYLCRELKTIRIPNTVTSIGYAAFGQCGCPSHKYVSGAIFSNCDQWTNFRIDKKNSVPLRYNNAGYVECASDDGANCKWFKTGPMANITSSNPFVCKKAWHKGGWCGAFDAAHLKLHQ
jgi:hypothetical protein